MKSLGTGGINQGGSARSRAICRHSAGIIGWRISIGITERPFITLPGCVPTELLDLQHVGVLPEGQLVLAEPVGRHELLVVSRPLQGAHLKQKQITPTNSIAR